MSVVPHGIVLINLTQMRSVACKQYWLFSKYTYSLYMNRNTSCSVIPLTCLFLLLVKQICWTNGRAVWETLQPSPRFILGKTGTSLLTHTNAHNFHLSHCSINAYRDVSFGITSELSCLPKNMSEEMAFAPPNFFWASSETGNGPGSAFLLAVVLRLKNNKERKRAGLKKKFFFTRA